MYHTPHPSYSFIFHHRNIWRRSAENEAIRYVVFSIPLLPSTSAPYSRTLSDHVPLSMWGQVSYQYKTTHQKSLFCISWSLHFGIANWKTALHRMITSNPRL
jgi:hypothetical protein